MVTKDNLTAVILSGGQSSRMQGKDKGLILLNDKPLISYVVDVIDDRTSRLLISANRNVDAYQQYGEVISDELTNFQGPLAGISTALSKTNTTYLLILPCDSPMVNKIVIDRLIDQMDRSDVDICVADDGLRMHPAIALIRANLENNLLAFLESGERKLGLWIEQNNFRKVDCSNYPEAFVNLNSPRDFDKI